MKTKNLREKTEKELLSLLLQEREKLRKDRFQVIAGQLKDINQLRKTKKKIARILTLLKEKHAKA